MKSEQLLEYCMKKPGAAQDIDNKLQANQIKVADVMFAMIGEVEGREAISLKTTSELAEQLRAQYIQIVPGEHLNKAHWSTVFLDGELPDSKFYFLIDSSYQRVVAGLPEVVRQELANLR